MIDEEFIEQMRAALLDQRAKLERISGTTEAASATVELDQTRIGRLSRMDAMQSQAMAKEVGRRNKLELAAISAALQRIEDDEYGLCRRCDEEIALPRLRANPAAVICIECAEGGPQSR